MSSSQHDELQTAESPLKTVSAKGEKYVTCKGSQRRSVTMVIRIAIVGSKCLLKLLFNDECLKREKNLQCSLCGSRRLLQ